MSKISVVMDSLYGKEISEKVYDRLESIDAEFNAEIQTIAYDHYWALPGLSLKEKSLVTLTSLIALKKEEQSKIHFMGFLNSGGTFAEVIDLLLHLGKELDDNAKNYGFEALKSCLIEKNSPEGVLNEVENSFFTLIKNPMPKAVLEESLIDLLRITLTIVSEDCQRMENTFSIYMMREIGNLEVIRHVLMQLIVYCGFPIVMNGFSALRRSIIAADY